MEPNSIKLKLKDGDLEVNGRLADMSDLIKELTALGGVSDVIPPLILDSPKRCQLRHREESQRVLRTQQVQSS